MRTPITDPNDPQHEQWRELFSKYSWWKSTDGKNRVFVLLYRFYKYDDQTDELEAVELLEFNQEKITRVEWNEFFRSYRTGLLKRTSSPTILE